METLLQDLRYSIRSLARSPGLTLAAVLTLGLGIGANSAMFGVVDRLFFRPPAHVLDPDHVVRVNVTKTRAPYGSWTQPLADFPRYSELKDHARALAAVAASSGMAFSMGRGLDARHVSGEAVSASFFPLTGVHPERGRFFTAGEDRKGGAHVAVLSHEFWHAQFADDPDVLGKALQLNAATYTVIGVAPRGFSGIDLHQPDVWVPLSVAGPETSWPMVLDCDGCYWMSTIARLAPGATTSQAANEATALYRGHVARSPDEADSTATVSLGSVHQALGPNADNSAKL